MSRLDNWGPFNVFFTVSCADYRWQENLTAVLRERGIGVRCNVDVDDQTEEYEVFTEDYGWIPMEVYKEEFMDETLHEILRRKVVTATRNYQQRVKALMKSIILHPSNPLSVKHYSKRLDFQGRGAGHDHGVLWLDIDKLEKKVDDLQLQHLKNNLEAILPNQTIFQNNLKNSNEVTYDLDLFCTIRGVSIGHNSKLKHTTWKYLKKLSEKNLSTKLNKKEEEFLHDLKLLYPLFGLKASLRKLQKKEDITELDLIPVIAFIDCFSTVSLHPAIVGPRVAEIAKEVNQHRHTKTCRKYCTICRFKFPKFPSYRTVIARPHHQRMPEDEEARKTLEDTYSSNFEKS